MSRIRPEDLLLPSVLDRLLDDEPENRKELPKDRAQRIRELKLSVARDIENLLNTRVSFDEIPEPFQRVRASIANYGVPDFNALVTDSSDTVSRMESQILQVLENFEHRIHNVKVTSEGASRLRDVRVVKFRIEGILQADPSPEWVKYTSQMSAVNKQFEVKDER
ncbi:MAG: type VI secretion system baseplate subunit TssE [Planctomycetota bacterium]|jgi:type VI secretion system protein ImpF